MKKKINIEGMSCNHCVGHVREALEALANIKSVDVQLDNKCAIIEGEVADEVLKEVVEEEGYDVISIETI